MTETQVVVTRQSIVRTLYPSEVDDVRQKYLQLWRQIEGLNTPETDVVRRDLEQTLEKLGIFIENVVGQKLWRGEVS